MIHSYCNSEIIVTNVSVYDRIIVKAKAYMIYTKFLIITTLYRVSTHCIALDAKIPNIIVPKPNEVKPVKPDEMNNDRACDCEGDRDGKPNEISVTEIEQLNEFEDELQNIVYIK